MTRIALFGTGRVSRALAHALAPYGAVSVWGRASGQDPTAMISCHDIIVIAVADDALEALIARVAGADCAHRPLVVHVSGRCGAAVLAPLARRGAHVAAVHPAMTFVGDAQAEAARMRGARFAVTAPDDDARSAAHRLVAWLGGVAVDVPEAARALYHAALCHASNHLVTLIDGAATMLRAAGVDDPAGLIAPLVRAALDNSLDRGFAALSGPILRGDAATLASHFAALERDCPALVPAYRAMALATLDRLDRPGDASLRAIIQPSAC